MKKIPLETTIAGAYRFLFMRILSILGTLWLPLLVLAALWAGIVYLVVPHGWWQGQFPVIADKHPDPAMIWAFVQPFAMGMPLLTITGFVLGSMMTVGLMRLSLGQTKSSYIFFSLGGDTWRLVAAYVLLWLIAIGLVALMIGIAIAGAGAAGHYVPKGPAAGLTVLLVIAAACFFIYAMVRFSFFVPAVVVAEHRIGLGRAWQLGGGNFWRIILIVILIAISVAIVAGMISNMTMMPIIASELMRFEDKPTASEVAGLFRAMLPLLPIFVAIQVLQHVASMGLMAGAMGTAYNALVPRQEETTSA
jgi:hypothetical protein